MRVELEHVTKNFGKVRAAADVSLTFEAGHLYAILGENGAGKSTLMKILSGYQRADSGRLRIDNLIITLHNPADALAHGIGMLHQDPLDVSPFTILEDFMLGQSDGWLPNRRTARRVLADYAKRLGFVLNPDQYIESLTIGERQQLEIVRLLVDGARVLILDEPTTGISEAQKNALFGALKQLALSEGMIVILISHKLKDVESLCDQVYVMRAGAVVGAVAMPHPTERLIEMMFGAPLTAENQPTTPPGEVVLRMEAAHIIYENVTVKVDSFEARAGEVIGLAGLDGSGQQEFLRAWAGLTMLRQGRLYLDGQDITRLSYHRRAKLGIGYAPAGRIEEGLVAGLTVADHFALTAPSGFWINQPLTRARATAAIEHYHIKGEPTSPVESLSGGNQQRVLLALLPLNLKVLLLENPTRGLDVESANWVWSQLLERRKGGTTLIFTSPELDELVEYSNRIAVFFGGRLTLVDDPANTTIAQLGERIGGKDA